jgi:hypothetical protein
MPPGNAAVQKRTFISEQRLREEHDGSNRPVSKQTMGLLWYS